MGLIAENLDRIRTAIDQAARRAGRNPDEVRLVAVSKTKPADLIREAIAAGQVDFGENYVQEARDKIEQLDDQDVQWHFIGHLQRNKARLVAPDFHMVHTVDSPRLAAELGKRAVAADRVLQVLIEVNIGDEQTKQGIAPQTVENLVKAVAATQGLALRGLMILPPFLPPEQARPYFVALRNLRDRLAASAPAGACLDELSMGMSGDFEAAIEEGATLVRVGTSIFGAR